jgi:hypothetical protein
LFAKKAYPASAPVDSPAVAIAISAAVLWFLIFPFPSPDVLTFSCRYHRGFDLRTAGKRQLRLIRFRPALNNREK